MNSAPSAPFQILEYLIRMYLSSPTYFIIAGIAFSLLMFGRWYMHGYITIFDILKAGFISVLVFINLFVLAVVIYIAVDSLWQCITRTSFYKRWSSVKNIKKKPQE